MVLWSLLTLIHVDPYINHPFEMGFSTTNHPAIGYPHDYGNHGNHWKPPYLYEAL